MGSKKPNFTDKEWELMQDYLANSSKKPRMNLIHLISNVDPNIAKLGMNSGPYMALDRLCNDEQIDFACNLELRKPVYIPEAAKRAGVSIEKAAQLADELCRIGVLEYTHDEKGVDRIVLPIFVVGMMEALILNPEGDRLEKYPEVGVAFHKHCEHMMEEAHFLPIANHGVHRVVPIETAIENESRKVSWEELSKLIEDNADGSYALCECICRKIALEHDEASDEPEIRWCMPLGDYAKAVIRTGKGIRLTKEEYIARIREAEDRGFVHNVCNHEGTKIQYICNCDYKTCMSIRASILTNIGAVNASNFKAEVDPEKCVACGECVQKCPMNAVRLGRKLPQKTATPYVDITAPAEANLLKWPKENWNLDWQYNRKNVREETGTSPCKVNCPAHVSVQGYLKLAAQGRFDEALELIKKANPLPAVCGTICNRRCELACTRGDLDSAVAIDDVKKFLAYRELEAEKRFVPKKIYKEGHKIAIIGAGPAGLSCAYYLAERGHSVTVFDKQKKPGGMLMYGLPSFRLEKSVVDAEVDVLRQLGVEFKCGIEVGKDITIPEIKAQGYKGIYIAPGLQGSNALRIEGDEAEGVMSGLSFMYKLNDGEDVRFNGKVVVIGGGNIAADIARTASRCGASSVTMVSLESYDEMPCGEEDRIECAEDGVDIKAGYGPLQIETKDNKCKAIKFKKCLSVKDENGKFAPKFDENDILKLEADYVLYCIGQKTDWANLLNGTSVKLTNRGLAIADPVTYQTADPDIFVGGDAYTGQKFCIDAIAAGKQAAISLHRYAWGHNIEVCRDRLNYSEIDKDNMGEFSYDTASRQIPAIDITKKKTMKDEHGILTEAQVISETSRCLKCGAAYVDQNLCLGCGVCTTRCKMNAISIKKVFDITPVPNEELYSNIQKDLYRRRDNLFPKNKRLMRFIVTKVIDKGTTRPKPFTGKVKPREW